MQHYESKNEGDHYAELVDQQYLRGLSDLRYARIVVPSSSTSILNTTHIVAKKFTPMMENPGKSLFSIVIHNIKVVNNIYIRNVRKLITDMPYKR